MTIKAQSLAAHMFTPKSQEGDSKPARFKVRPLSSLEWYQLADGAGNLRASAMTVLENGLVGWENVENAETGEALAFTTDNVWTLPREILDEIGEHIVSISRTTEEEAKN